MRKLGLLLLALAVGYGAIKTLGQVALSKLRGGRAASVSEQGGLSPEAYAQQYIQYQLKLDFKNKGGPSGYRRGVEDEFRAGDTYLLGWVENTGDMALSDVVFELYYGYDRKEKEKEQTTVHLGLLGPHERKAVDQRSVTVWGQEGGRSRPGMIKYEIYSRVELLRVEFAMDSFRR